MKLGKFSIALAAIIALGCLPFGCAANATTCILEAEKAVAEPVYDGSVSAEVRANSRSENITSGGKYIGKMYEGNTVTWIFSAERQADCRVAVAVANADKESAGFTVGLGEGFAIKINESYVTVPEYTISAGTEYGDGWQELLIGTFTLKHGINTIVYTALSSETRLNVDYLSLASARAEVSEHAHFWKNSPTAATCLNDGQNVKTCGDCGYYFTSEIIPALGHKYGNYHYDGETHKMVASCERCDDRLTANAPSSKYFGEVYVDESSFTVKRNELLYEAEDAFVCIDGGLSSSNMNTYIGTDNGEKNSPSGGKCVENISRYGNYIRFIIEADRECKADLVFIMSNTLYTPAGIGELNPLSDYVYCTVNGAPVDFSFVSFPGFESHSYFEWRYVVIKDVELGSGQNTVETGPKKNPTKITMPNTDALKIYTDESALKAVKCYDINEVTCKKQYDGQYENSQKFTRGKEFTLHTGVAAAAADLAVTVRADENTANLASRLTLTVNGATVNLEGIALERGESVINLHGVGLKLLKNAVAYTAAEGLEITGVEAYAPQKIIAALDCAIAPEYDFIATGGEDAPTPSFIFEAEDANLGKSVSSREGVELLELNVYENTGKRASGNTTIGNFAVKDNTISWKFFGSASVTADIVLMLASANYDEKTQGNTATDNLQNRIVITVNGVAVKLDDIVLTVDSVANYYDWQAVTIPAVLLGEGENEVKIRVLGYGAPNMDVMYVYADGANFSK